MAPRDKKTPTAPANTPSTPSPKRRTQPSPPGAPQKTSSSPQKTISLPIRQPEVHPSSSKQPERPATPIAQVSQASSSPSTPKPTRSPPKPAAGSATPRPAPDARRTSPSAAEQSSPQKSQQLPSRVLLPAPHLHETALSSKALTIFQAFNAPLPTFEKAYDFDPSLGKHTSSSLVESTKPPRYWSEVDVAHYLALADSYLAKPQVKSQLALHYAPSLEPTFRVRREADVVTYAATHLTHAVNMAIDLIFPDSIESVSEVELGNCRPDFIWRSAGSKTAKQTFAVLEMKSTGGIDVAVFRDATEAQAHAADKEREQQEPANEEAEATFFKDGANEYSTIKQMTTYAQSDAFDTCYIACFDGPYLFLGVFSPGPGRLPLLKGTLLPCHGDRGHHARKALLGWLIEARIEKQRGKNHRVPRFAARKQPSRSLAHRISHEL